MKKIDNIATKLTSFFSSKKKEQKRERDDFDVTIYKTSSSEEENGELTKAPVSQGCGNWCQYLQFDKKIIWKITDFLEDWSNKDLILLPSDVSFREDKKLIAKKDYENAEK